MTQPEQVLGGDTVRYPHLKEIMKERAVVRKETAALRTAPYLMAISTKRRQMPSESKAPLCNQIVKNNA
jgi:hypothetical protein